MKDLTNPRVGILVDSEEVKDDLGVISKDNEFIRWVNHATYDNPNLQIAIKVDKQTSYPIIKKVMDDLRSLKKNKFLLITSLQATNK